LSVVAAVDDSIVQPWCYWFDIVYQNCNTTSLAYNPSNIAAYSGILIIELTITNRGESDWSDEFSLLGFWVWFLP